MGEMRVCELKVFNKIKPEISEVFDVGTYTDVDYYNLHPTAIYHLFEPMKEPYENLKKFSLGKNNIRVNNVGCSNNSKKEKMYKNISSIFIRTHDITTNLNEFEMVDMIRLDDYINENGIKNLDFIKIDVEGSEYLVLDGMGDYIDKFKFIQVEYGGTYRDVPFKNRNLLLKDIFSKLSSYDALKLEDMTFYSSYNESMEDYYCCNYLFYKPQYINLLVKKN